MKLYENGLFLVKQIVLIKKDFYAFVNFLNIFFFYKETPSHKV